MIPKYILHWVIGASGGDRKNGLLVTRYQHVKRWSTQLRLGYSRVTRPMAGGYIRIHSREEGECILHFSKNVVSTFEENPKANIHTRILQINKSWISYNVTYDSLSLVFLLVCPSITLQVQYIQKSWRNANLKRVTCNHLLRG